MNGVGKKPEYETIFAGLARDVRSLADGETLTIAEFTIDGIVTWDVWRDQAGTPHGRYWGPMHWSGFYEQGVPSKRELGRKIRPEDGSRMVLVQSTSDGPYVGPAFDLVSKIYKDVSAYRSADPFDKVLTSVLARDPLTQSYELVVLRRAQSGRLVLTGLQLFPPGAQRGDRRSFTVRCEPGDEHGTVFAVVAVQSVDQVRLVSQESLNPVSFPAANYKLTAELRRPSVVRFDGLPAKLREDHRSWPEIVAKVPDQLDHFHPTHLICAVEVSGTKEQVQKRLERLDQLIRCVADEADGRLNVSLISYGSHAIARLFPEQPTRILIWARTSTVALAEVSQLAEQGAAETGYPRAAQLECVLTKVAEQLTGEEGRPVLVTVGSRPAFPHRADPVSDVIPCPDRRNWRSAMSQLLSHPGIVFGAISDNSRDEEIWACLGSKAFAPTDAVDVRSFAVSLGLLSPVQHIPLPLIEPD